MIPITMSNNIICSFTTGRMLFSCLIVFAEVVINPIDGDISEAQRIGADLVAMAANIKDISFVYVIACRAVFLEE